MIRTVALAASALALFAATPALAQVPDVASALARPVPPIPEAQDRDYPGVIQLTVDATDLDRKVMRVRQTIPVAQAGPMVLLYPKYLPGNHAATGPIQLVAGLQISAGGQRLEWVRDPIDPYAFHIEVPAGASQIDVAFDFLSQHEGWRVLMTPEMANLQFEKHMLYPAGYAHRRIQVQPSVRLPEGWGYGVALEPVSSQDELTQFAPVSVETLADSPMFAGVHYRQYDLDPGADIPVRLNIVADEAGDIQPSEEQLDTLRSLVTQADRLFGARPFDRYDFLLGLTDTLGGIGLEHHRSSENTVVPGFFEDWPVNYGDRELLPHEYVHAWNGKRQRPADQLTANLNIPVRNSLLWVYEGQTQYWGSVLAARSGLVSPEEARINLANIAAFYENQAGREWRALQDTTNQNLLGYRSSTPWPSWSRGTGDYYRESLLVWLDADTLIREETRGRRSLDDFARGFFGGDNGSWTPRPYTFEDLVAALNTVHPHDWATFLRSRLDAVGPEAEAPLDGLERGGWRLIYVEEPNAAEKKLNTSWQRDFQYSLGFTLSSSNRIGGVRWNSPAFEAGLVNTWELVAVNDVATTPERLREAVTAAKGGGPIRLLVKDGDRFRTVDLAYTGGLRHPRLERIDGAPDRLTPIYEARRR
ncbi:M61 family metallopeptidase [Brevundimonas lutea]|uniref:M61 family metallopeptidase n=1 Tax=Brevundimonas lutea TaxID=2293980 RepID=UPI000F0208D6|nr:M61 family metallopeptidase [Brevundimonas lutea]